MVRSNRWKFDEALSRPGDLFLAAKSESPQLVIVEGGRFVLTFEDLSKRGSGAKFLAAGGPEDKDL